MVVQIFVRDSSSLLRFSSWFSGVGYTELTFKADSTIRRSAVEFMLENYWMSSCRYLYLYCKVRRTVRDTRLSSSLSALVSEKKNTCKRTDRSLLSALTLLAPIIASFF